LPGSQKCTHAHTHSHASVGFALAADDHATLSHRRLSHRFRSRRQIQPLLTFAQERLGLLVSTKLCKKDSNQQSFDQRR
jgi:hypothetical protein